MIKKLNQIMKKIWKLDAPNTGLILGLHSPNERRRYKVVSSLIG